MAEDLLQLIGKYIIFPGIAAIGQVSYYKPESQEFVIDYLDIWKSNPFWTVNPVIPNSIMVSWQSIIDHDNIHTGTRDEITEMLEGMNADISAE